MTTYCEPDTSLQGQIISSVTSSASTLNSAFPFQKSPLAYSSFTRSSITLVSRPQRASYRGWNVFTVVCLRGWIQLLGEGRSWST